MSAPSAAVATTSPAYRIVWDDFQQGFNASGENARWAIPSFGTLTPDDGVVTTSRHGLRVDARGVNARTGAPAFTVTMPQDPLTGGLDHVKWFATTTHVASSGFAGFDAVRGRELSCETRMAARTYGTEAHPFGGLVRDPGTDLRLASVAMNAVDPETGMVFDFFLTNNRIYAFYERGPYLRAALGDYAGFSFAIPVGRTAPGQEHDLRIGYDRSSGTVRWYVDKREVYRVHRIGHRIDRKHMMIDYGGVENLVEPRQLNCGMGMFSVLDGAQPGIPGSGLVRLANDSSLYFDPVSGHPVQQVFHDERSLPEHRLFGQGASFTMRSLVVSSRPRGTNP
ncbi:hypothetical protein ALI144C_36695 [Actinosynnema sp. ALI-1.44]|nr:hypothetical protein ALI144C_36695 [Actinosynnema sp. ALI-1.44]